LIKAVGIGLVIALVLVEIHVRFWFIYAVDDLAVQLTLRGGNPKA